MINKLLAVAALSTTTAAAKEVSPKMKSDLEKIQRDGIDANSSFGRQLINKSRRVEQQYDENGIDISFVSEYSLKFMGCHHVTQWASEEEQGQQQAYDQEANGLNAANGRIRSKGLVRYKLCPSDSCTNAFGVGCTSNYGEYVVDMNSFLEIYMKWRMEEESSNCELYRNTCYQQCYESATANCYTNCYKKHGVNAALCSNNGNPNQNAYSSYYDADADGGYGNDFNLDNYLKCGEYDVYDQGQEEAVAHYLGPYCANQGGDIKLGFFQDQYCTIPSTLQASYFEKQTGVVIPYTKTSLVSAECMSCERTEREDEAQGGNNYNYYNQYNQNGNNNNMNGNDYYNYDANGNRNYYVAKEVNEMCGSLYMTSGKCETYYVGENAPYPEEGACSYIEGVKQLQDDGIIRSHQMTSSKAASVAIGIFTGLAVLLGGYVYYLKSKIQRSRVNLAGATTSLA